ncbi:MAG: hypothetical protein U5N21_01000 [Rhodococcus sp. (in: high G+C Gram-positive bacteria)]|nr:hypothetical protein [Rhodococcus sp. (in: high G+C Gram-positive bacteria)]
MRLHEFFLPRHHAPVAAYSVKRTSIEKKPHHEKKHRYEPRDVRSGREPGGGQNAQDTEERHQTDAGFCKEDAEAPAGEQLDK